MIVLVVWDDAHVTTGTTTVKRAGKAEPERTETVAHLIAENEHGVVLGTDRYPKHPKTFRIINFIPWSVIVEYYEVAL